MKKWAIIFVVMLLFTVILTVLLYYICNIQVPLKSYTNEDFGIETYVSSHDEDSDGIDDQTDFYQSVLKYLEKKPKYKSEYYKGGYPTGEYGVCTDVIVVSALDAGYDFRKLVNEDILSRKSDYNIDVADIDIDFRRAKNLKIYLDKYAVSVTTDISKYEEWQAGDIVVFKGHIGVISQKRNKNGIPYLLHHANPFQTEYEEAGGLERLQKDIVGHYRLS